MRAHNFDPVSLVCVRCGALMAQTLYGRGRVRVCDGRLVPVRNKEDNPHVRAELELLTPAMFRSVAGEEA